MMPAGRYYVGDLCYVMTQPEWEQFCAITIQGNRCIDGEFTLPDGRKFATYGTAWGDGCYRDQFNNEYSVDAGLIGCIRVEDIKAEKYDNIEELGAIHEFPADFTTRGGRGDSEWDGNIMFGRITIETDSDGWDEEEYDCDDE
jgi:hypothetical protein